MLLSFSIGRQSFFKDLFRIPAWVTGSNSAVLKSLFSTIPTDLLGIFG